MRAWARRTTELHDELAAIADVDPRWWLLAGGAAAAETVTPRASYVASDAEPGSDTFIGVRGPEPVDRIRDAIACAHAARGALLELDGLLLEQPLAVTIARGDAAYLVASPLEVAAFAVGDQILLARLADDIADERELADRLLALLRGVAPAPPRYPPDSVPFVCVSIGDEPVATARHGHRRAWVGGAGPWLGIGRSGGLGTVSTCHMVVDGYGHAWLTSKLVEHHFRLLPRTPSALVIDLTATGRFFEIDVPPLANVPHALPLGVAWREIPSPAPRSLPLAYALGCLLHRAAKRADAKFSPTFQLPIAPGEQDDPARHMRRVVPAAMSVRFVRGEPEPYDVFEARARSILTREAAGRGLCTRLLAAAKAAPVSIAWKRKTFSSGRPRWLDKIAEVVGGRASLSRLGSEVPLPPSCAVSAPARMASKADPLGSCVITILDDGVRASITACGSGALAGTADDAADLIDALLDELRNEG